MKKEQIVEVNYIKKTSAMIIVLIALVIGFALGIGYSSFDKKETKKKEYVSKQEKSKRVDTHDHSNDEKFRLIKSLENKLAANPLDKGSWVLLGNAYYGVDMHQKSIDAYKKYLELNPNDPNVWTDMGTMYRRLKNPKEAIVSYNNALKVDPKHEMTYINKGIVLLWDLKDKEGAIKTWSDLLKINPNAKLPNGQPIQKLLEDLHK